MLVNHCHFSETAISSSGVNSLHNNRLQLQTTLSGLQNDQPGEQPQSTGLKCLSQSPDLGEHKPCLQSSNMDHGKFSYRFAVLKYVILQTQNF